MTLARLLQLGRITTFQFGDQVRSLREPDGPPSGEQLLRLKAFSLLAVVEPGQVEPITNGGVDPDGVMEVSEAIREPTLPSRPWRGVSERPTACATYYSALSAATVGRPRRYCSARCRNRDFRNARRESPASGAPVARERLPVAAFDTIRRLAQWLEDDL